MAKQKRYEPTYIRQWRRHRRLTLDDVCERLNITPSQVSLLERGLRGYTQNTLETMAAALRTDAASLLLCDPSDPHAIWALWDKAKAEQRKRILEAARRIVKNAR